MKVSVLGKIALATMNTICQPYFPQNVATHLVSSLICRKKHLCSFWIFFLV